MDGKVVVITGASGALGSVVAEAAVARGARVAADGSALPASGSRPMPAGPVRTLVLGPASKARHPAPAHSGRAQFRMGAEPRL